MTARSHSAQDTSPHSARPVAEDGALPAVWVNGERQSSVGGHLSPLDRGLTLSDGLFETMHARGGAVFRLDQHVARLERGLATLEIPAPPELRAWVSTALRESAMRHDASVRVTVTRGVGGGGIAPPSSPHPTAIVVVSPFPDFPFHVYEHGISAHVASGVRNERAMTAGLKTLAYTDAIVALLEARRAGADEALFLDMEGHCSEATASNLFAVIDGTLVTPPASCGALPGITRAAVMELARALDLPVDERAFGLEELLAADEAFLTSSLRAIAPLVRVDTQPIGRGAPGPLTRELMAEYAALVARECPG
jgi:branched-chain amino acid aminotransferase